MNGDGEWGSDGGSDSGTDTGTDTDTGSGSGNRVTCNRETDSLDGNGGADWDWDGESFGGDTASGRGRVRD